MSYIGNPPVVQASRVITELVATAGQTDIYPLGGYTPGDYLDVEINGSALKSTDYTATDGVKITLAVAMAAGDDVRVKAYGNFLVGNAVPADGTVTTAKIVDAAVTAAKLAALAVTNAKIADAAVTQAKLDALVVPLGVGQTWQAPSRTTATTYTNSTGRPIYVAVQTTSNPYSTLDFYINGTQVNHDQNGGAGYTNGAQAFYIIPNGATYSVQGVTGSIAYWWELR